MIRIEEVMSGTEKLVYSLMDLYGKYGYSRYRMSKFEEYSLYGKNIDFLVSDSVITFTDTNGKLMALKPDVTLSIVKNAKDAPGGVTKVCYNENVYRVSKGTGAFKEIMQAGLECIGDVDCCLVGESLSLAAESLKLTGKKYVLAVSHLGLLALAVNKITDDGMIKSRLLDCVGKRNVHGIKEICNEYVIDGARAEKLVSLLSVYGSPEDAIAKLSALFGDEGAECIKEMSEALSVFCDAEEGSVTVDFSVTADANYYGGVVFKGYVDGVPDSVLSGGCYDKLMKKLGKKSRAVGFAVYVDTLERIFDDEKEYDFDVMIKYSDGAKPSALKAVSDKFVADGKTVFCCKDSCGVRCRETYVLEEA